LRPTRCRPAGIALTKTRPRVARTVAFAQGTDRNGFPCGTDGGFVLSNLLTSIAAGVDTPATTAIQLILGEVALPRPDRS
jgi:hypothetical protein